MDLEKRRLVIDADNGLMEIAVKVEQLEALCMAFNSVLREGLYQPCAYYPLTDIIADLASDISSDIAQLYKELTGGEIRPWGK